MTHKYNSYQSCDDESHIHPYETNAQVIHAEILETLKYPMELPRVYPINKALRAVVELHKPYDPELENLEGQPLACHNCNVLYPCPTIQAIEVHIK